MLLDVMSCCLKNIMITDVHKWEFFYKLTNTTRWLQSHKNIILTTFDEGQGKILHPECKNLRRQGVPHRRVPNIQRSYTSGKGCTITCGPQEEVKNVLQFKRFFFEFAACNYFPSTSSWPTTSIIIHLHYICNITEVVPRKPWPPQSRSPCR